MTPTTATEPTSAVNPIKAKPALGIGHGRSSHHCQPTQLAAEKVTMSDHL